jgi:hypothetical protein
MPGNINVDATDDEEAVLNGKEDKRRIKCTMD